MTYYYTPGGGSNIYGASCITCARLPAGSYDVYIHGQCSKCYSESLDYKESKPMKKYRCKIDSPFGKKGEIVQGCPILLDNKTTANGERIFLAMYMAKDYPELFEEIPDRWMPEEREQFWCIFSLRGKLLFDSGFWDNDKNLLDQNNVFRTKEKSEKVLKMILELLEREKEV